jgi:haloalkane dehalogenase
VETLRTPDERFVGLPDYAFEPHYAEIADGGDDGAGGRLRVHYLDEGSGPTVLLLHGEPTWSYLYRHMIPIIRDAGYRVIAPDLVGFGKSDKPTEQSDYTYARHVEWMRELLFDVLDLTDVHYFGQDWGSLIGLRLVGEHPERYARVAIGNAALPTGDTPMSEGFMRWQQYARDTPQFHAGRIVNGGSATDLPADVIAAYDAPFPGPEYQAGARAFPQLVPTHPDDPAAEANRAAWETLRRFHQPFLCTFSDLDLILGSYHEAFRREVPGAYGQPHVTIEGAAHFLQEDKGPELAAVLVEFFRS